MGVGADANRGIRRRIHGEILERVRVGAKVRVRDVAEDALGGLLVAILLGRIQPDDAIRIDDVCWPSEH